MNINEYWSQEDQNPKNYRGRMTLKSDFGIVDANEYIYAYLGAKSVFPLPVLVHPDDAESMKEALRNVMQEPQHLIVRLCSRDDKYRYVYCIIEKSNRVVDGKNCIDVEVMDIIRLHNKLNYSHTHLLKYRKFMSLSDKMYFEYNYGNGEIVIYEYMDGKSNVLFRETLGHLQELLKQDKFTFKQRAEFETLQEYFDTYAENVDIELDGETFGLTGGYLHLRGGVVCIDDRKELFVATITVTGEKKNEEKYYMSPYAYDSATRIYNKRAIAELAMDSIARASKYPVFLCVMDIDDFKMLNDTFGHMAGDEIIAKVAGIIGSVVGERGYVGRFGGDEFLLVIDQMANADELVNMLKTIRKNAAWQCQGMYQGANVTTSIGIAQYPQDASNYEDLFKIADKCLYIAKAKGKNRFILYTPELHKDFNMGITGPQNTGLQNLNVYATFCRETVDIFNHMGDNTRESLDADIRHFLECYDIDRFVIYGGEQLERLYCVGEEKNLLPDVAFLEKPPISDLFDANGLYAQNRIMPLMDKNPPLYEKLAGQGTQGYLLVKITQPDGYKMVVAYDILRRARKWSMNEKGLLYISAQILAKRFRELESTT